MTTTFAAQRRQFSGRTSNKVPEVDVCFWIVKILCLTVGASFAESVTAALGVGLDTTTVLFLAAFCGVLVFQLALDRHVPEAFWLTVTLAGALAGLLCQILTDEMRAAVSAGTVLLGLLLVAVLAAWRAQEHTLSLNSIRTPTRESFYWVAVLVSFALGAMARTWAMASLGWTPLGSVLLPAALCAVVLLARRGGVGLGVGLGAELIFWTGFTVTGPLGADLGDWSRAARSDGGLGLGTGMTTGLFLMTIMMVLAYRGSRERVPVGSDA
jgi:uncharacterized membrane-anchored protein